MAFKKLAGVTDVKLGTGAKKGAQKVIVTSTTSGITKEQAVKALGKKAKTYVVTAWTEPAAAEKDKG